MKIIVILIMLSTLSIQGNTQSQLQGEYTFHRQEMVAGFKFTPDEKFEFFFSYGAVDRIASGTFSVKNDTLTLKSNKPAGQDFTVKSRSKQGKGYVIKVQDANTYLLQNVKCTFLVGNEAHEEYTNEKGEIKVAYPHVDKIYVQHELFPDVPTLVKDQQDKNNSFILTLNPSLGQVSFKHIYFNIKDDSTISCMANYFMMMDDIHFKKEKE